MLRTLFILLATCFFSVAATNPFPQEETKSAKVQMALLLDTSNSMDGMIDQAKSQLWKMVNELTNTTKNGESPDIEIALYEYGNDNLSATDHYIRQIVPMTNDLDEISEQLFQLKTNGGSEYCGAVMLDAVLKLNWSKSDEDLKMIVISGNEPFDQGPVTPEEACKAALKKGISITTIFCGDWKSGIRERWEEGAKCAVGEYLNIDSDEKVVHIPTPYDEQIATLNTALNATYLAYGKEGRARFENQAIQDANAFSYGSANIRQRAAFKAKKQYRAAEWDMVDSYAESPEIIEEVKEEELPEELKGKNKAEIEKIIKKKKAERERIQTEILELEKKANAFEAEERRKMAGSETNTLDKVMEEAVQKLAVRNGFKFE